MGKKVQAGSDGKPGKRRRKKGKGGGGSGGSHAPMTPAEEQAERERRMNVADEFTKDKPMQPPHGGATDPFGQHG